MMMLILLQDPKRSGHRGFGFVTFAEDGVAERVSRRSHEICGQQVSHLSLKFVAILYAYPWLSLSDHLIFVFLVPCVGCNRFGHTS